MLAFRWPSFRSLLTCIASGILAATLAVTTAPSILAQEPVRIDPRGGPHACVIVAHDALTGEELWRRRLIPGPGEFGDESALKDARAVPPGPPAEPWCG